MTKRRSTTPTAAAIDAFAERFDVMFNRLSQRENFRHYLCGLLVPLETNKHLRGIAHACAAISPALPLPTNALHFGTSSDL